MSLPGTERRLRIAEADWEPHEIELFLFSAACWLPHRIHYDHAFAEMDGHPSLVVHGPLQIARMVDPAARWAREHGGRVSGASFRHVSSAFVGDRLLISLDLLLSGEGASADSHTIEATVAVVDPVDRAGPTTIGQLTLKGALDIAGVPA
jgi:hydroxyacyl-ACP dehydratase HTD2-like protein with hotdog domain